MGGGISKAEYAKLEAEKEKLKKELEETREKQAAATAEAKAEKKKRQDINVELTSKITTLQGELNHAMDEVSEKTKLEDQLSRFRKVEDEREASLGRRSWQQYVVSNQKAPFPETSASSLWRRAKHGIIRHQLSEKKRKTEAALEEHHAALAAVTESLESRYQSLQRGEGSVVFTYSDHSSLGLLIKVSPAVPQLCRVTGFARGPGDKPLPAEEFRRIRPGMLLVKINDKVMWNCAFLDVISTYHSKLSAVKKGEGEPIVLTFAESPVNELKALEKSRFASVLMELKHEAAVKALSIVLPPPEPEPEPEPEPKPPVVAVVKDTKKEEELERALEALRQEQAASAALAEKERARVAELQAAAEKKAREVEEMAESMRSLEAKLEETEAAAKAAAEAAPQPQENDEDSFSFSAYDRAVEKVTASYNRTRDYSVLVDASASMRLVDREFLPQHHHKQPPQAFGRSRWDLARDALESLVPHVVERDEDGITLYFFSSGYRKYTHVNSVESVRWNFAQEAPKGGTMLADALADAVIPDNEGRPETILVITDGAPENRKAVERVIVQASEDMQSEDDIRIVFVQVGTDAAASRWLSTLPQRLQTKFDIVETISSAQLARTGVPFAEWVAHSVISNSPVAAAHLAGTAGSPPTLRDFGASSSSAINVSPADAKRAASAAAAAASPSSPQLPSTTAMGRSPLKPMTPVAGRSASVSSVDSAGLASVASFSTPLGGHLSPVPSLDVHLARSFVSDMTPVDA